MLNAIRSKSNGYTNYIKLITRNSILIAAGLGLIYICYAIGFPIPCIFKEITGYYCAGCGITRSIISLINLDFYQAFRYNPIVYVIFPLLLIQYYLSYKGYKKMSNLIVWFCLIVVILFMILRNTESFIFLAPTFV